MKTIATWISENPYIAAAGLIATFLGLIYQLLHLLYNEKESNYIILFLYMGNKYFGTCKKIIWNLGTFTKCTKGNTKFIRF